MCDVCRTALYVSAAHNLRGLVVKNDLLTQRAGLRNAKQRSESLALRRGTLQGHEDRKSENAAGRQRPETRYGGQRSRPIGNGAGQKHDVPPPGPLLPNCCRPSSTLALFVTL